MKTYKHILEVNGFHDQYDFLMSKWNETHRYYHNIDHLNDLFHKIEQFIEAKAKFEERQSMRLDSHFIDDLILTAFYHDVSYDIMKIIPQVKSEWGYIGLHESKSIEIFNIAAEKSSLSEERKQRIRKAIADTSFRNKSKDDYFSNIFWEMDNSVIYRDFAGLLDWEHRIFREFQGFSLHEYKAGRIAFLESLILTDEENTKWPDLIEYVKNFKPKIGIYPGSFNPFHVGHMNILEKAEKLFDKVILVKGFNPTKNVSETEFPEQVKNREIIEWAGFTNALMKQIEEQEGVAVTLIRGLRNGKDLDYEVNQLRFMQFIDPDIQVVYIQCDKEYEHISSSAIRSIAIIDKKEADKYLL